MVAAEPFCVRGVEHREPHGVVEPSVGLEGEPGVQRQPGGERVARCLGGRPQDPEGRPGPLGIDVVGGDR